MPITLLHSPGIYVKEVLDQQAMDIHTELLFSDKRSDALIRINGHTLLIEAKAEITPVNLPKLLSEAKADPQAQHLLFLGNYITPKAKELLREKSVNYLDGAGNLYLKLPGLLLHIDGNQNPAVAPKYKTRAFSKAGGAVLFQFLRNPALVNEPQRLIAEYAGVSLGTIPKVFEGLKKEGFLIKLNKNTRELNNTEQLLHKWIEVLRDKILPGRILGRYKPVGTTARKMLKEKKLPQGLQWGGEPAAALLTDYLVPEEYTLFAENKTDLVTRYKLLPSATGELTVYEKFWHHPETQPLLAHPLLVYAQLIISGDSRNLETAKLIYDEHLGPKL